MKKHLIPVVVALLVLSLSGVALAAYFSVDISYVRLNYDSGRDLVKYYAATRATETIDYLRLQWSVTAPNGVVVYDNSEEKENDYILYDMGGSTSSPLAGTWNAYSYHTGKDFLAGQWYIDTDSNHEQATVPGALLAASPVSPYGGPDGKCLPETYRANLGLPSTWKHVDVWSWFGRDNNTRLQEAIMVHAIDTKYTEIGGCMTAVFQDDTNANTYHMATRQADGSYIIRTLEFSGADLELKTVERR